MAKQINPSEKQEAIQEETITHASQSVSTNYHEVKTLLVWNAPGRPFKKRTRSYYSTTLIIMFFIEVILFLFSQYMLMLVVVSLVFLAFAFATVPPHNFHFRISSEGVFIEDHFSLWQELYDFYITRQNDQEVVVVRTRALFPGEIYLSPNEEITIAKIKSELLPFLPYREFIKPTFVEKAGTWMNKNFPLEPVPAQQKHTPKVAS